MAPLNAVFNLGRIGPARKARSPLGVSGNHGFYLGLRKQPAIRLGLRLLRIFLHQKKNSLKYRVYNYVHG